MSSPLPGVTLTQIPVSPSATLQEVELYPCLVSPLYRVVKEKVAKAYGALTLNVDHLNVDYPYSDPGSIVDTDSVVVKLLNATLLYVDKAAGTTGITGTVGTNKFIDTTKDFISAGVKPGDIFIPGDGFTYVIQSVPSLHTLSLTTAINMAITGSLGYKITTFVDSWTLDSLNFNKGESNITITSFSDGGDGVFTKGTIALTYRALRTDAPGLRTLTSFDQVTALMEVDPMNKLGYYIKNAVIPASGNTAAFMIYILPENTSDAYMAALSELTSKNVYMLVPLCDDLPTASEIKATYLGNANTMSAPIESAFRMLFSTTPLVTQEARGTSYSVTV